MCQRLAQYRRAHVSYVRPPVPLLSTNTLNAKLILDAIIPRAASLRLLAWRDLNRLLHRCCPAERRLLRDVSRDREHHGGTPRFCCHVLEDVPVRDIAHDSKPCAAVLHSTYKEVRPSWHSSHFPYDDSHLLGT